MGAFVQFMQSVSGRVLRIVVGIALIAVGLFLIQGAWGFVVAIIGLVPLIAGLLGFCLIAPLFGFTLKGERSPHPAGS